MDTFADRFVQTTDGLNIYLRDYQATQPSSGVPVLCLHGLTRNSKDFAIVAPRIAALGRRVLAMDVRGRGRSDYDPEPMRYGIPTYVQDVQTGLNALGIDQVVILGTSMGGLIAMVLGALAPGRMVAAILNDVGPEINPAAVAKIAAYVGKTEPVNTWAEAVQVMRANYESAAPGMDDAFWLSFAERCFDVRPDGKIALSYDPNIAAPFGMPQGAAPPDLKPVFQAAFGPIPTLLVRGGRSELLLPEHVADMRALKPDLSFVEVPNVGHAPQLDEPAAWDAILSFLAKVP
jgi:pimeloyl-ACP methyl ester carboxylesterase